MTMIRTVVADLGYPEVMSFRKCPRLPRGADVLEDGRAQPGVVQ
jgi:hypothetical protein